MVQDLLMLKKNMQESYSQDELNDKYGANLLRSLNKRLMNLVNSRTTQPAKIANGHHSSHSISSDIQRFERFFEFLLNLEKNSLITKIDIFNYFAELFDSTSEDTLGPLFSMMEEKMFNGNLLNIQSEDVKKDQQTTASILNIISRVCKSIMRKLSVTHDTGFRGKVQKLIASVFPLTHPSGLNKLGNFNTKNSTNFETLEEIKQGLEHKSGISVHGQISDYNLYKNFWNLQKYLTNPFNIFTSNQLDFEDIDQSQGDMEVIESNNNNEAMELIEQSSYHKYDKFDLKFHSINGDEEEGQAEEIIDKELESKSAITGTSKINQISSESNLTQVLSTIRDFISKFMSQPIQVDKDNAQILLKYPKYLSKHSLLNLQFQDYLFRENFLTQVLIFTQTIANPINLQQKKFFIITEDEKKLVQNIEQRVSQLLQDSIDQNHNNKQIKGSRILGKRRSMAQCVDSIIQRESNWAKWKENKCTNFEKQPSQILKTKKRDAKRAEKLISCPPLVQPRDKEFNHPRVGLNLRKYLRYPKESLDEQGNSVNIKAADQPMLNDLLNPYVIDLDVEQAIEETYKNKHNQVVSWRFLRQVSFVDLVNFHGRPEFHRQYHKFEGNAEEQAFILYSRNKKKQITLQSEQQNTETNETNGNKVQNGDQPQDDVIQEKDKAKVTGSQSTPITVSSSNGTHK
ncbi:UNKNOWN [Stylonychia lemnae]|uniref:Uncharacterized protein n=1 Tax=Stylonychia lemnae TaxID=5949 RepID=A0A077ZPZ5_STYLE|nr:UNKNOWN [Stylonychia lemnae]|eukprot:CDW71534.1 UNKNOWN [Stylonychia lemnae]